MIETTINYKSEYIVDKVGHREKFRFDPNETDWFQDAEGNLLPAGDGQPYQVLGKNVRDEEGNLIVDPDGVLSQVAFKLGPAGIITQLPQDNFQTVIGEIEAINILVGRGFKGPDSIGHPRLDMGKAVIASGHNRAEPNGADPTETESFQWPWAGK